MNCQDHLRRDSDPATVSRRWFLQQCGVGLGSIALDLAFIILIILVQIALSVVGSFR